jgi:hypothetical protein
LKSINQENDLKFENMKLERLHYSLLYGDSNAAVDSIWVLKIAMITSAYSDEIAM